MRSSRIEEWSLFDHLTFLFDRWLLVASIPFVLGASALAFSTYFMKSATAEGILQVAHVRTEGFVEKPSEVVARIRSRAFLSALLEQHPSELPYELRQLKTSASQIPNTELIRLIAVAGSEQEAKTIAKLVACRVASQHKLRFKDTMAALEHKIEEVDRQIAVLEKSLLAPPVSDASAPGQLALAYRRSAETERLSALKNQRIELALGTVPTLLTTTMLIEGPAAWPERKRSKTTLFALVIGGGLSVFLAYLLELRRTHTSSPAPGRDDDEPGA